MSSLPAYLPTRAPREVQPTRHIEIVATRSQRRRRPRIVYGIVAVAGLFVILMAQLLLSIALSQGTYQISSLQTQQKNLARDKQTLTESLNVLQSPQNLAAQATTLGMVMNNSGSGWLRLSDGSVLKNPTAAGSTSATDPGGQALVTNALLTPDVTAQQDASMSTPAAGNPASTTGGSAGSDVASGSIPAPVTH
ncbi:MAG: hypothetical protein V4479_01205 [Actinomycetota bacterium]